MPLAATPCAVKLDFSYRCRRAAASLAITLLARPELRVRTVECRGLVVDDGWGAPMPPARAPFMTVLHVVSGTVVLRGNRTTARLGPGTTLVAPQSWVATARFERARVLEITWAAAELEHPRLVAGGAVLASLAAELDRVGDDGAVQRTFFEHVGAALAALGIALPEAARRLEGGPTARDLRLGAALAEQFRDLKHKGSISHLSDDANLSPRQLHRVLGTFSERYGIDARGWRDVRNRWRLRLALALLSLPELTIGEVADEVGLSSSTCLARFFAQWSVPSPSVVRREPALPLRAVA